MSRSLLWNEEVTLDMVCERLWDLARGVYVDEERPSNHTAKKWFAEQKEVALPVRWPGELWPLGL